MDTSISFRDTRARFGNIRMSLRRIKVSFSMLAIALKTLNGTPILPNLAIYH